MQTLKRQQTHNYQQPNLKNPHKNKLSQQLQQEEIHRNRDDMEGYQWGGRGKMGRKYRESEAQMVGTKFTEGG